MRSRPPSAGGLRALRTRPASAEEEPLTAADEYGGSSSARPAGTPFRRGSAGPFRPRARGLSAPGECSLDRSTAPLRGAGLATIESSGPGHDGGDADAIALDVRPPPPPPSSRRGGSGSGGAGSSGSPSTRPRTPNPRVVDVSAAAQKRALPSLPRALVQWGRVARLWYTSHDWPRAWAWTAAALALSGGVTAMMVRLSYVQAALMTGLAARDPAALRAAVLHFAGQPAPAAPLYAASDWVCARLAIEWRAWLAGHLMALYYGDRGFYRLHGDGAGGGGGSGRGGADVASPGLPTTTTTRPPPTPTPPPTNNVGADPGLVDNPDQRIADDASAFTQRSVDLVSGFVGKASMAAAFAGVLASTSPPLVGVAVAYAAAGTAVTALLFGRRLAALEFLALAREGDLRYDLVRTREHSEAIAFFGGGPRERRTALARLGAVLATRRVAVGWTAGLNVWVNAYTYAASVIPVLVVAPPYFRGALPFGAVTQAAQAFDTIETAINYFVTNLVSISTLAAQAARLEALRVALLPQQQQSVGGGRLPPPPPPSSTIARLASPSPSACLALADLTLWTPGPNRRTLARGLSLTLAPGQSLLIVGPSGCGKSALLRAIAGLWTGGAGSVTTPPTHTLFFLPQKPFMPVGSLRAQLLYPGGEDDGEEEEANDENGGKPRRWWRARPRKHHHHHHAHRRRRRSSDDSAHAAPSSDDGSTATPPAGLAHSDRALEALLAGVGLADLAARFPGGLDARAEWAHVLSLGEQQRVSAARLLASSPSLAFLDEATSALDPGAEAAVYTRIAAAVPSYVSVGHHAALAAWHSHVLEAVGGGAWRLLAAGDWVAGRGGGGA